MKEDDFSTFTFIAILILTFMLMVAMYKCMYLENENTRLNNLVQEQGNKIIQLEEENEHLWNNYYENVSDYKGEYEYYE